MWILFLITPKITAHVLMLSLIGMTIYPLKVVRETSHPENKSNLSCFLSYELLRSAETFDTKIVTAGGFLDRVYAESSNKRDVYLLKATHEEANTRIVLHTYEACLQGYERTVVVCRDKDVLVLLLHSLQKLTIEVWFQTGTSKRRKFIPVHNTRLSISETEILPTFQAITRVIQ
ncbi:hypothetical protein KUTeg_001632 [Tegillarca granosa]|uniref:Uncharacterized protein n=1 Tax=Tegillarca granosa TaxID=220873 RepID=A0ABQ9FS31_TEGGR|nr:hypothetical protein KUTeg_001632 [Tegillarca granosa]